MPTTANSYFLGLHADLLVSNHTIIYNARTSGRTIEALADEFRFHANTAYNAGCADAGSSFLKAAAELSLLASSRA